MQSDANLVKQFLNGDEQAFHRLIIKYQPDIYALTLSYVRNPEDAKELTQEVFFEAYKGISSLKQPESFCFWLRRIARNQYHIWQRKEKGNVIPLEDMISDAMPTDELMILRESFAKVMQVIEQLPETEKDILKSRYLEDASYEELQKRYDLSYKALNMRLLRAKQKVRARVEKLLAGIGILSWHDALNKMLLGGVEAVKISVKTKLIVAGIAIIMVSGGTGIFIWHSHQSTMGSSGVSDSQITKNMSQQSSSRSVSGKNLKDVVTSKSIDQETEKLKDEVNKSKKDESSNQAVKSPTGSTPQTEQQKETLSQKFDRISNSEEFINETVKEAGPFMMESNKYLQQVEKLKQERQQLEDKLANASGEEQDQIQKELDTTKSKYREARINQNEYGLLSMDAIDRVKLKYFTIGELENIFGQKSDQVKPEELAETASRPGLSEEDIEVTSEAKKRLQEKGFIMNSWTAKLLSWL